MKIIVTEEQYKLISESQLKDGMQNLINESFEIMKQNCEYENYFDMMVCDGVEIIEEIRVVDVNKVSTKSERNNFISHFISITIDCYIDYFKSYFDLDEFVHELTFEARNLLGGRVVDINLRDTINKRKNFDW